VVFADERYEFVKLQLMLVPYDSGYRGLRMGHGPMHFAEHGAQDFLTSLEYNVETQWIESQLQFRSEVTTAFDLNRALAIQVAAAHQQGDFPLILAGNCNTSVGVVNGSDPARTGVIWFDRHGDYNTPDTSSSGFLDGMALAVMTGQCWHRAAQTIPNFEALPPQNIIHIGALDFDPDELERMKQHGITVISPERTTEAEIQAALQALKTRVESVHIHLDLDVLDPLVAPANHYADAGGLKLEQVELVLRETARQFKIASAVFSAYDPDCDPEDRMVQAGFRLMKTLLEAAHG
jgi:arginase